MHGHGKVALKNSSTSSSYKLSKGGRDSSSLSLMNIGDDHGPETRRTQHDVVARDLGRRKFARDTPRRNRNA